MPDLSSKSASGAIAGRGYAVLIALVVLLAGVIVRNPAGRVTAARQPAAPAACVPPTGNIVQNGGFEAPALATYRTYTAPTTFSGWTVSAGSVDLETIWLDFEGSQSLDLAGVSPGTIYQDLCTMPGIQYKLSFALAGNPNELPTTKVMDVWWNDGKVASPTFSTVGRTTTSMGWTQYEFTVQATGSLTRLLFRDAYVGMTRSGPALDAVSVQALPGQMTATPLPCVPSAGPNMVRNGSFETPLAGPTGNLDIYAPGAFDGWVVGYGSVGVTDWWQKSDGAQALDLAGTSQGSIYQDICTTPGQQYRLTFAFAGNPAENPTLKTMVVAWGSQQVATLQFSTVGRSVSNMGWMMHEYILTATSDTMRLEFRDAYAGTTRSGPALDAVSLQPFVATPTPTASPSATATATASPSATATTTASPTATATVPVSVTATAMASATATATASPSATAPVSTTATQTAQPTGSPAAGQKTILFMPMLRKAAAEFPIAINRQAIATRPVIKQSETYYSTVLNVSAKLPAGGHFYLSASPSGLAPVMVDDELLVVLDGKDAYRQFLTYSRLVQVPAAEVAAWAAASRVEVYFQDRHGSVVGSTPVWLLWEP
ncbi:MAG TPA: DUF642 domain-containing protein [Herpetosiphonaceae bacterium]|nr:DUF642 domain-containing protein [Herpetosiphonaceae bacterium]